MHFFNAVPSRWNEPSLDAVVTKFFGGIVDPVRSELFPSPHEPAPSMRLTKNVYELSEVFQASTATRLVLSSRVKNLLLAVYDGAYLPCELEHCFSYPYVPGDNSFENDPCFGRAPYDDATAIVRQFAERYRCSCPVVSLFELVAHRLRDVTGHVDGRWKDSVLIRLSDPGNGLQTIEAYVSPSMVDEFGIIWDWGYWCRDDVFEVLDPLLRRPFFWTTRVKV